MSKIGSVRVFDLKFVNALHTGMKKVLVVKISKFIHITAIIVRTLKSS
jgi:hypothetical protein